MRRHSLIKIPFIIAFFFFILFNTSTVEAFGVSDKRIAGSDRYETAARIADEGWPSGSDTIIVARGDMFPDALAGAPLASKLKSPILLTTQSHLPPVTKERILNLKAKNAVILGGPNAISPLVQKELKEMGIKVERIYGEDRYETAIKISEKLNSSKEEVIVVTGNDFPDALAVAPYASEKRIPIILTRPDQIPPKVKPFMKGVKKTYIIGGPNAISKKIEDESPGYTRISGSNRYETAIEILNFFYDSNKEIYISTGRNFADALTGSVLAAKNHTGVLLIDQQSLTEKAKYFIGSHQVKNYTIFGGEAAVSKTAEQSIKKVINILNDSLGASSPSHRLSIASDSQAKAFKEASRAILPNEKLSMTIPISTAESFTKGQIVIFPNFIGEILSVNNKTGTIILGEPAFEDVFSKIDLKKDASLSLSDIKDFTLSPGVTLDLNNKNISNLTEWNNTIKNLDVNSQPLPLRLKINSILNEKNREEGLNASIKMNGLIELSSIKSYFSTRYKATGGISEMTFSFEADETKNIDINYDWGGPINSSLPDSIKLADITYSLGSLPIITNDDSEEIVKIPINMTISFMLNQTGQITANTSVNITESKQQTTRLEWDQTDKSFNHFYNTDYNYYEMKIEGSGEGSIQKSFHLSPVFQIGNLTPVHLSLNDQLELNTEGNGETIIDIVNGKSLDNSESCFNNTLTVIQEEQLHAKMKTLGYNADKGNIFQRALDSQVLLENSFNKCSQPGTYRGVITDVNTGTLLNNVKIKAFKNGELQASTMSGNDGNFKLFLPEGTYSLEFSKDGFQNETLESAVVKSERESIGPKIYLTSIREVGAGTVSGKIQDALSGENIHNAIIQIRKGFQNQTGDILASTQTKDNGSFLFTDLQSGAYTATVEKNGYIPYMFNLQIKKGSNTLQRQSISPLLAENEARFILSWDRQDLDLDLHLTGPSTENERFHLYWNSPEYIENNSLIANLSDSKGDSGVPETITLYHQINGIYRLSVFNYSYRLHEGTLALANSNAKIDLYMDNQLVRTFYIPAASPGKLWTVLELDAESVLPVNSLNDGYVFYNRNFTNSLDQHIFSTLTEEK